MILSGGTGVSFNVALRTNRDDLPRFIARTWVYSSSTDPCRKAPRKRKRYCAANLHSTNTAVSHSLRRFPVALHRLERPGVVTCPLGMPKTHLPLFFRLCTAGGWIDCGLASNLDSGTLCSQMTCCVLRPPACCHTRASPLINTRRKQNTKAGTSSCMRGHQNYQSDPLVVVHVPESIQHTVVVVRHFGYCPPRFALLSIASLHRLRGAGSV